MVYAMSIHVPFFWCFTSQYRHLNSVMVLGFLNHFMLSIHCSFYSVFGFAKYDSIVRGFTSLLAGYSKEPKNIGLGPKNAMPMKVTWEVLLVLEQVFLNLRWIDYCHPFMKCRLRVLLEHCRQALPVSSTTLIKACCVCLESDGFTVYTIILSWYKLCHSSRYSHICLATEDLC